MFSRTFKEVAEWYLDNMGKLDLSPSDQKTKRSAAKLMIAEFGSKVLSHGHIRKRERLDRMTIREWRIKLLREGKSQATVSRYLSAGSTMIKKAWDERDWDLPNPFDGMTRGLKSNVRKRILTEQEQAAILMALRQPYRDIAALILETGLRDGEAVNLEWDRVDLASGWIRFDEGLATQHGGSKSGRREVAAMSDKAREIIGRQPRTSRYVFTRPNGERARYNGMIKNWHVARERAGVEHCTPHDLRRTWGYQARANGVDLDGIQAQLRHSSRSTTERVYASVQADKAMAAVRVLNVGLNS